MPDHYLWFACKNNKLDPTKPMKKWDTAWRAVRDAANLPGLRFDDLRHTAIAELAEMGVPDSALKSITGRITQRMLEHYSHIRMNAKRQTLDRRDAGDGPIAALIPAIGAVDDELPNHATFILNCSEMVRRRTSAK